MADVVESNDAATDLATRIMALPWRSRDLWTVEEQADRHGELQEMIAARLSQAGAGGVVDEARAAVERLANVQMNISLEEWSKLSSAILAALAASPSARKPVAWTSPSDEIRSRMTVLYTPPAPVQTASVEVLPCDVAVAPSTIIRKGCKVSTLMLAINQRKGREVGGISDTALASLTAPTQGDGEPGEGMAEMGEIARIVGEWRHGPMLSPEALRQIAAVATPSSPVSSPSPAGEPVGWIGDITQQRLAQGQEGKIYPTEPCPIGAIALYANPAPAGGVREALALTMKVNEGVDATLFTAGGVYVGAIRDIEIARKIVAALSSPATGEVVAWLHTLHMESGQTDVRLTFSQRNAFGRPGLDYSEEYTVMSEPLVRALNPAPGHGEGGL